MSDLPENPPPAENAPDDQAPERAADVLKARMAKLETLQAAGEDVFKVMFERTHLIGDIPALVPDLEPGGQSDLQVRVGGRLMAFRRQGKLVFADLVDGSGRIQLLAQANRLGERFARLDDLDIGDWLGVWGPVIRTRRGELSVAVEGFDILTKGLRPLPEKWHGLKDVEGRYRQRYLDLIANPQAREVMLARSRAIAFIRSWLMDRGFIEVETPMLQPVHGGALARPFTTYHEALNMELYLRVAPELYLKRLVVGGVERVFEINRNFRNEGVSVRHNPEFTMLEAYQAFADYNDMAELLEGMVSQAAIATTGGTKVPYQGDTLDLTPPFRRARLIDLVKEAGVDVEGDLPAECERMGVKVDPRWSWGKLLLELYEKKVERNLMQPTFVLDYPKEVSPLARTHRSDPRFTEHLDLVIAGMEVGVAYSELTDPVDQRRRFESQSDDRDDEAHQVDEDFLKALEYGMPPTGGLGFGIDRFLMVLTDQSSIREVILFPAMRPEEGVAPQAAARAAKASQDRPAVEELKAVITSVIPEFAAAVVAAMPESGSAAGRRAADSAALRAAGTPSTRPGQRAAPHDPGQIPQLLVVGTGKVASSLSCLAERSGFHVRVAAGPDPYSVGEFEGADEVIVTPEPQDVEALRPGANTYVAICSEVNEFAEQVLLTLMPTEVPYLGVMLKKGKAAALFKRLGKMGFDESKIARVRMPIGLALRSQTPEEIAISILAELVGTRRGMDGRSPA
ncbi:MAG TPA: lysine--tRNA ligase [Actinomycetota bacterium]|nr:lysine--tRNA ligase [Actinomycetota bacterium]